MSQIKKTTAFGACLLMLSFFGQAQAVNDSTQHRFYLYEHFIDGYVRMKSGTMEHAPLNYNTNDQTILFERNGQVFTLTNISDVDTVYLQGRKLVPVDNEHFYEVITNAKVGLYAKYEGRKTAEVATTDFNGTTRKSPNEVSNTVSSAYINRDYYKLKDSYLVNIVKEYYLKRGNSFYKVTNEKQLEKVFSHKSDAIAAYIQTNQLNLKKEDDLVKVVEFANMK